MLTYSVLFGTTGPTVIKNYAEWVIELRVSTLKVAIVLVGFKLLKEHFI